MNSYDDGLMWALVKEKPEAGLWMRRVPIPEVGPNDVMIKIHKTAICGTDVHIWQWNEWAQHTIPIGLTAGHEYVGEVVKVGAGVLGFKPGDYVSGEGHITCGKCRNCLEGHKENCKDAKGVGVNRNGAFAEYLVIPASNVWPCKKAIPEELYAIFDPFGNATHTALTYPVLGEDVLVAGAGPIGCMAAGIVRFAGARHVVVTDFNEYRLDLAKKMGATRTVNLGREKLEDVMRDRGLRRRPGDVRRAVRPAQHDPQHEARRKDRAPGPAEQPRDRGPGDGDLQRTLLKRHLRAEGLGYLVFHDDDAAGGLQPGADHYASL